MKKIVLETPGLYADHHVTDVRRLLLEVPGVEEVYASSAFQVVEITFDPQKISEDTLNKLMVNAGYMNELMVPGESGVASSEVETTLVFQRHTQAYAMTNQTVSFTQEVNSTGRPLWNCPGIGILSSEILLQKMEE